MEAFKSMLPVVINVLLIILLIVLIVLVIKFIYTLNRVNKVVDNVEGKVNSLNGLFSIIDVTSKRVGVIYDKLVDFVLGVVGKLSKKNKEIEEDLDE